MTYLSYWKKTNGATKSARRETKRKERLVKIYTLLHLNCNFNSIRDHRHTNSLRVQQIAVRLGGQWQ